MSVADHAPTNFAGWRLSLYPDAAEAVAIFRSQYQPREAGWSGAEPNPEASRVSAARRAKTKVRRYCAANRLNRLGTLTYGPPFCEDPNLLREHVGSFFRELRRRLGGRPLPYLWTAERHKDGRRLHVHFAVGQFVGLRLIQRAWPHGIVHIKLLGNVPYSATALHEARVATRYLAKYVAKSLGEHWPGLHRYEVAQAILR